MLYSALPARRCAALGRGGKNRTSWHPTSCSRPIHQATSSLAVGRERCSATAENWASDVLIVDGTNLIFHAKGEVQGLHTDMQGTGLPTAYATWLAGLRAVTQAHEVYVVFDTGLAPQAGGSISAAAPSRGQVLQSYKQKRAERSAKRSGDPGAGGSPPPSLSSQIASPQTLRPASGAGVAASRAQPGSQAKQFQKRNERLARVAEEQGACVLWAPPGLEADDLIASLALVLVQQQQAPLRVTVASSDSDMQQILGLLQPTDPVQDAGSRGIPSVPRRQARLAWLEILQRPGPAVALQATAANSPMSDTASSAAQGSVRACAMRTHCLGGMCWLPVRLHTALEEQSQVGANTSTGSTAQAARSSSSSSGWALPPRLHADYLALVGKQEAGVTGAGVSEKAARSLLRRFGSVEGVARAILLGELTPGLQPGKPRAAGASQDSSAAGGPGGSARPLSQQEVLQLPEGIQRALRNLLLTRLRADPATVSLEAVRRYRERLGNLQGPPAPAAAAAGAVTTVAAQLPLYSWRMQWLAGEGRAMAEAFFHHSLPPARPGHEWVAQHVTPEGLMFDAAEVPRSTEREGHGSSSSSALLAAQAVGEAAGEGAASSLPCAVLLLGPPDFGPEAVQVVGAAVSKAAGANKKKAKPGAGAESVLQGLGLAEVGAALAAHVGPRSGPAHLPNKLQAVVSPRVLMLCKAAKKCGWALEVVPFWELMQ